MLLVTTPIEATWGSEEDIMFLGEWCKLYEREEIWSERRYDVLQYHWDDRDKLRGDFNILQELNKKILKQLTQILNSLHSVNHSERYWEILLGFWVNIFTGVIFDRWRMDERDAETNKISKCYKLNLDSNDLAANGISDFIDLVSNDDYWNQAIYTILIEINTRIEIQTISENGTPRLLYKEKPTISYGKRFLSYILFNKFKYFSRDDDAVILNSYLPWAEELKLHLGLGQFPVIRKLPEIKAVKTQKSFRNWKIDKRKSSNKFYSTIAYLLPKLLPKIYLENYDQLVSTVEKLKLPKKPKFIFTSNAHYNNSVFSEYAAKKNISGTQIILGDHGGYGCNAFNASVSYQLSIANISLSWGWKDRNYPNIKPFGIFKTIGKIQRWNKKGLGLMIQVAMPRYSYDIRAMPIAGQMNQYFRDQYNYYASLPKEIREKTLIRLYHADYGWGQKNRWEDNFNNVLFDNNKLSINRLLRNCRICICTYNATTFLETLSLNVPTIIFWNKSNWEIHDRAVKHFKELENVGIFFSTPEKAALKVAEIWDDIPGWWKQEKIQKARINFCNNFAREVSNPAKELKKIITRTENG